MAAERMKRSNAHASWQKGRDQQSAGGSPLARRLILVALICVGLERRHDPEGQQGEDGKDQPDIIAARRRRRSLYRMVLLQDRAAAQEADAGDDALQHAGQCRRIMRHRAFDRLHQTAAGDGHQRKGAQARAAFRALPVPADRQKRGER